MFRKLWQRRRLALIPAMILVAACGSAPASPTAPSPAVIRPSAAPAISRAATSSQVALSPASPTAPTASEAPVAIGALDLPATEIKPTAAIQAVAAYTFAVTGSTLWIGSPDGLVRIDPDTNTATVVDPEPGAIVVARGSHLWRAALRLDRVTRYLTYTDEGRVQVSIPGAYGISPSGPIWVAERNNGRIDRLDDRTGKVLQSVVTGRSPDSGPSAMLEVGRELWVAQVDDRNFARVDPQTGALLGHVELGLRPCQGQGVAGGAVWLCQYPDDDGSLPTVRRLDPATGTMGPAYRTPTVVGAATEAGGLVWLPIGPRLIGMDPHSGAAMRALDIGGLRFQENLFQIVRAAKSIWVGTTAGRVLRFDPADFH